MESIKSIADDIYEICFDVDKNITGLSSGDAGSWARANSKRHAHTIAAILNFTEERSLSKIRVLNASGIACGHQDFSIKEYLNKKTKLRSKWVVSESPENKHLENTNFKKYLHDLDIGLVLTDLSTEDKDELYGKDKEHYDIVLFTEISEHLDHTTFLRSLTAIRRVMKDNGILIITTPNLVSLPNRIRIIFGNGDGVYNGDGTENLNKGVYGHITLYDRNRLTRILKDVGFEVTRSSTITFGHGPIENEGRMRIMIKINDIISRLFSNSRINIFIVARKAEPIKISLEV